MHAEPGGLQERPERETQALPDDAAPERAADFGEGFVGEGVVGRAPRAAELAVRGREHGRDHAVQVASGARFAPEHAEHVVVGHPLGLHRLAQRRRASHAREQDRSRQLDAGRIGDRAVASVDAPGSDLVGQSGEQLGGDVAVEGCADVPRAISAAFVAKRFAAREGLEPGLERELSLEDRARGRRATRLGGVEDDRHAIDEGRKLRAGVVRARQDGTKERKRRDPPRRASPHRPPTTGRVPHLQPRVTDTAEVGSSSAS